MDRQTLRAMMDKSHAFGRHPRSTDHRLEEAIADTNYDKEACDMSNSMMVARLTMGTKLKVEEYSAGVGSAGGKNGVSHQNLDVMGCSEDRRHDAILDERLSNTKNVVDRGCAFRCKQAMTRQVQREQGGMIKEKTANVTAVNRTSMEEWRNPIKSAERVFPCDGSKAMQHRYSNKATGVNLRVELDLALHQTRLGFELEELEARMRRAIVLCV